MIEYVVADIRFAAFEPFDEYLPVSTIEVVRVDCRVVPRLFPVKLLCNGAPEERRIADGLVVEATIVFHARNVRFDAYRLARFEERVVDVRLVDVVQAQACFYFGGLARGLARWPPLFVSHLSLARDSSL